MNNKRIFTIILLLVGSIFSYSQDTLKRNIELAWEADPQLVNSTGTLYPAFSFSHHDMSVNAQGVPVFSINFPLNPDQFVRDVTIKSSEILKYSLQELGEIDYNGIDNELFDVRFTSHTSRGEKSVDISITPFKLNTQAGTLDVLREYSLDIITGYSSGQLRNTQLVKENSVLSAGEWFKIRLNKTGIYKITREDLTEMGLDVSGIDPRNLRIYGNGAGMLPEANDVEVPDDLVENAIFVAGQEDGSFDQGDYILFYGESPTTWKYNPLQGIYQHKTNIYSNHTYYFIHPGSAPGKRIEIQNSLGEAANYTVEESDGFAVHELDEVNLVGTGRTWYQQLQNNTFLYEKEIPHLKSETVDLKVRLAARSFTDSYFTLTANEAEIGTIWMTRITSQAFSNYADENSFNAEFIPSGNTIRIGLDYTPSSSPATPWLDYLEINYKTDLVFSGSQMNFRNHKSIGPSRISEFVLSNADAQTRVWNVSDPMNVKEIGGTLQGTEYKYTLTTEDLLEFIAFNGSSFNSVEFIEKIENQNLHAVPTPELVIVTHSKFLEQANTLADHHRNHDQMEVVVAKTDQIYNEFSFGAKDITAIRNFMRMIYNRPDGEKLRYLLLFGDASYDYKDRIENNSDYVPSWETQASINLTSSFVTDDYYGLLDEDEGGDTEGKIDLGIGRLPVSTTQQAKEVVNKILHYTSNSGQVMRQWRNRVCFIADDEDNNTHFRDAERMSDYVKENIKNINIEKIYLDAYPQESTPSGQRYPAVRDAINKMVEKGALVINYSGHGGELGLAHEQVLGISDVNNWENMDNLSVFITATCEFSRYDDPRRVSAGELVFLNPDGGAIAMYTTTRATYASQNYTLNKKFYEFGFKKINGEFPRMGDVLRLSKTAMGSNSNKRKYALLGDPALRLAFPQDSVVTTKINDIEIADIPDTLKALAKVSISGELYDCQGNKLSDYNGTVFPTVYDKETKATTYGQDEGSLADNFFVRKNIVYKGKTPIENGKFTFSFIVPKDIAYNFGFGRISYYARNEHGDATGYFNNIVVGGFEDNVIPDESGPEISLYINDTNFVSGGITDQNPKLLARFEDESGINTVGNGIGHDITAVLDNDKTTPFILNDYYEADLGDYTSGSLLYPLFNLSEGNHVLDVKVWDVYNNSSDASIAFVVVNGSEFIIEELMNYPNPMLYNTNFVFAHNQPGEEMDVEIQIFSLAGRLERTITRKNLSTGYKSTPIQWDGTNNNGSKLGKGFYIYRLVVQKSNGQMAEKTGKLLIVNN